MTITYLSVCSGIESASVAWEPLGFSAVGYAEVAPFASAVLAHRFGSNLPGEPLSHNAPPNFGDFTAIPMDRLPAQVDVLVGGTPCQAFSIAGRRLSLADVRGNLTLAYVVLAHELADNHGLRNAVWENVPGVLSTDDNAFGCFLGAIVGADAPLLSSPKPNGRKGNDFWKWSDEINGLRPAWPSTGMVAGPRGRAAWRVLDAQFFGLAQRRERVFVVADFGSGADPAAILFERQGVRGNFAPRRETREGVAGDAAASTGISGAFGGGRTSGPVDQAACLTANGGGQAMDFEVETFLVETANTLLGKENDSHAADMETYVAHSLRGEGFDASEDGTGRGTPIIPELARTLTRGSESAGKGGYAGRRQEDDDNLVAYAIQERAVSENPNAGPQGIGVQADISYTLEARHHVQAVAFAQNTRDEVRLFSEDGSIVGALSAEPGAKQQSYIAFPERMSGTQVAASENLSPALGALNPTAVAFDLRGREGGASFEGQHDTANIRAASGGSSRSYVAHQWAVRRLTPLECSRLQGFPDDWSRIPWRGKPAELCPDGPQYKTYGNAMACNVMAWIGCRLKDAMPERAP